MAMTAIAIAAVAAPIIGGLMGADASREEREKAERAYARAYAQYDNVNIPDIEKMRLSLDSLTQQGIINPTPEQAQQLGINAMEGITTDPRLRNAQMDSLYKMSKMGEEGLTAEDMVALNTARRNTSGDAQARDSALIQNMNARGVGGSGVELASRLAASERTADIANQQAEQTMAMAQQARRQAIAQHAQLGGQIRSQDFAQDADIARSKNAFAEFNTNQTAAVQQRNVANANAAAAANLAEKQRIADTNVAQSNAQQQYNKQLLQQEFGNKMSLASARANAAIGQGNQFQNQANATAGMYTGVASGVGQAGMGYLNYRNQQDTNKNQADYNSILKKKYGVGDEKV